MNEQRENSKPHQARNGGSEAVMVKEEDRRSTNNPHFRHFVTIDVETFLFDIYS